MRDKRAGLPLVGQLASPIQSHWVIAHMQEGLQAAGLINEDTIIDKKEQHKKLLHHLQTLRFHVWRADSMSIPRTLTLRYEKDIEVQICLHGPTQAHQLLHAQQELQGWGSRTKLVHLDIPIQDEYWLHGNTYDAIEWTPHQLKETSKSTIAISLTTEDNVHSVEKPPGSFLFEILAAAPLKCNDIGNLEPPCHPGDRLWKDTSFHIRGAGDEGTGIGSVDLETEAEILFEQNQQPGFHLFPIGKLADLLQKPRIILAYHLKMYMEHLFSSGNAPAKIFLLACADNHWFLFEYGTLKHQSFTYDGLNRCHSIKFFLAQTFADIYGQKISILPDRSLLMQEDDDICGVIALINLGWRLHLWQSFRYAEAIQWACAIKGAEQQRGAGGTDYGTTIAWLQNFLPSRGVPESKAAERAATAVKKLGLNAVSKAIQHENPWRQLKQLGSNASRPFLWVQHDELKEHIAVRAGQKYGAAGPSKKKKQQRPVDDRKPIVQIPADQLTVPSGAFIDVKQQQLPFVPLDQIKADCKGITIATTDQAARFLQDSKKLSCDALGMLTTLEVPLPVPGSLVVENLTWPALYGEEALLVKGSLIQLGDTRASLRTGPAQQASAIQTALLRLQMYRGQTIFEWERFAKGPMKMLIAHLHPLQVCHTTGCGVQCGKFHPAVEETAEVVILDCFAWKWFDHQGTQVAAQNAASFSVMVRIPDLAVDGLMKFAGKEGFYPELRGPNGAQSKYAVIWLKTDFQGAQHALQINPHALHLARLHSKFGLSCLRKNEAALRKAIYPEQTFVDCEVKFLFQVGPWDYGVQKGTIQEAFETIPWKARVLKPSRGSATGRFWIVGSDAMPPSQAFPFGNMQITITKIKDMVPPKNEMNVIASMRTLHRLQHSQSAPTKVDPWQHSDPWSTSWQN